MKKLWSKIRANVKTNWISYSILFLVIAPLILNIGLCVTDIIYVKFGFGLTAKGLNNQEWLDFWKTYLSTLIAFGGVFVAWKSSYDARRKEIRKDQAKEYGENLEEEKHTLLNVCQSFDMDIVYKSILELAGTDAKTNDCKKAIHSARERILDTQVEFELLTDIADDFQKCENCDFNPCLDRKIMIAIRDLYYEMEKLYCEMLDKCDEYIENFENQRINEERFKNLSEIIADSANSISQNMKPRLIKYCKIYIDQKKRHKRELLQNGEIQYVKDLESDEMLEQKK